MHGYEIVERVQKDTATLGELHAIAYGALVYISEKANYYERCKQVAQKALSDMEKVSEDK
jgi:hypothetical protein